MPVDIEVLQQLVKDGFLTARPHPTADLLIWNYTPKTQYERYWTPETLLCRGLITNTDGTIMTRSFKIDSEGKIKVLCLHARKRNA